MDSQRKQGPIEDRGSGTKQQSLLPFRSEPERLIFGLNASDRVKRVLLALHWLSESEGMKTASGETMLDPLRDDVARMMRASIRTMQFAIEDARAAGYLTIEPAAGRRNLYVIRWPDIFAEASRAMSDTTDTNRNVPRASRRRLEGRNEGAQSRGAKGRNICAGGAQRFVPCAPQNPAEIRGAQSKGVPSSDLNELNELNIQIQEGAKTGQGGSQPRPRDWPTVTRSMLSDPKQLDRLFEIALVAGLVHDDDAVRIRFFATAQYSLGAKNAGGAFSRAVLSRPQTFRWTPICEDWARSVLRGLRAREPTAAESGFVPAAAAAFALPPNTHRSREQQQAAMRAMELARR